MSSTPATIPRTPWGLVILLGSLTALAPVAIDMYLPSLPAIATDLHASEGQAQATVATFLAGMAIGQFFYGPASDRIGRRIPVLFGIVLFTLASVFCAVTTSIEGLLVGRLVQALGACAGPVVARAIVRDRFDHTQTARILSLMMLIMGVAPILAPMGGGAMLGLGGWRVIFWAMAVFGAAMGVAALFLLTESRSAETAVHARSEHPLRTYLALTRNRQLVGYALTGGLNGATLFTYISGSPGLLIGTYGISPTHYGVIFAANAIGLMAAGQINRTLLHRRSPDQVLVIGTLASLASGVGLAIAAFTGMGVWGVLPMLFMIMASFGLLSGNTMAGALNVDPRRAGSISAFMGASSFVCGATASAISAQFHDGTARPMALVMLLSVVGSTLALFTLALRKPA